MDTPVTKGKLLADRLDGIDRETVEGDPMTPKHPEEVRDVCREAAALMRTLVEAYTARSAELAHEKQRNMRLNDENQSLWRKASGQ